MKKQFIYLSIAVLGIFSACKKADTTPAPAATTGTFVINGVTYTETASQFTLGPVSQGSSTMLGALGISGISADKKVGALIFYFPGSTKPTAGSYTLTSDLITTAKVGQVGVIAGDSVAVKKTGLYTSQAGTSAVVTVNSTGKLTVTLPTSAFPGYIFDNTTSSTNIINTTVNVSGTVQEN